MKGILVMGLSNAGKSSLLFQMVDNQPGIIKVNRAGGSSFPIEYANLLGKVAVVSWSESGSVSQSMGYYKKHLYQLCDATIFMIDRHDRELLKGAAEALQQHLMRGKEERMHEKPLLVFLNNKGLDLPGGLTVEKAERHLRLREKQVVDWSGRGLNAWLMGRHSRVGAHSPVKWLTDHLMEHVWSFVGVLEYTVLVDLRPSQP